MTPLALDILVGLVIVLSTVAAYLRGAIKEIFTLVTLILSITLAYIAGHLLVPEFNSWLGVDEDGGFEKGKLILGILSPPLASKVFSYGGTFITVFVILTLLGGLLSRWVKEAGLGVVDRGLGGVFGFFRGFLLMFLLYIPFNYMIDADKFPKWAKASYSVPIFEKTFAWANATFKIDEKIENRGSGVMIKFDKIDPEEIGKRKAQLKKDVKKAKKDLKDAIEREEKKVQKAIPDDQPGELLNEVEKNINPTQQPDLLLDKMERGVNPEASPVYSEPEPSVSTGSKAAKPDNAVKP